MMKRFIFLLLLLPLSAHAAPPAGNELGITAEDCRMLTVHQPAPDVAYKPGVDVHGKPVVEADLNPSPITLPETYSFALTVDAARYMRIATPPGLEGQAQIGTITVDKDGKAQFNGNPLEGPAQAALEAACARLEAPKKPEKPAK